ncbi:hypothetical protein [Streptomyces sp. NPDC000229]
MAVCPVVAVAGRRLSGIDDSISTRPSALPPYRPAVPEWRDLAP